MTDFRRVHKQAATQKKERPEHKPKIQFYFWLGGIPSCDLRQPWDTPASSRSDIFWLQFRPKKIASDFGELPASQI